MWVPTGKQIEKDALGDLTPVEVLFEFEEPLTFVCKDLDGQPLLAHSLCAEGAVTLSHIGHGSKGRSGTKGGTP